MYDDLLGEKEKKEKKEKHCYFCGTIYTDLDTCPVCNSKFEDKENIPYD